MKLYLILILCLPLCCFGQHEDLLRIIGEESTMDIRQKKIDSFLKVNERILDPKILADCYHDLGSKWYFRIWDGNNNKLNLVKAIQSTRQALDFKKQLDHNEDGSIEKTMYNLGYFLYLNGDYFAARNAYLELVQKGKDENKVQSGNRELGRLYSIMGDFYKAIDRFGEFIDFYHNREELSTAEISKMANAYIRKAGIYADMGYVEFSEEIKLELQKSDSIYINYKLDDLGLRNRINQIRGNRFLEIGKYGDAIIYHKEVLEDSSILDNYDLARVYNSLAYSHLGLKNYDESLHYLDRAISYDSTYTDIYENFGDLYLAQNEFEKGHFQYQKAIIYATDKNREINFDDALDTKDLEFAPNKIDLLNHIITKANGWLKYYEFDKNEKHLVHALETFALADKFVDIIRSESTEYQSKLFWREKGATLYSKAVEACYLLGKPKEAFYFMERNKALLLLEDVTNEQAKDIVQLPDSIAQREFDLKRAILLAENELQTNPDVSQAALVDLRNKIYGIKRKHNQFIDSISTAFPEYSKIKRKVEVLPYTDFKSDFVSEDEVVLQYILNDEQGYGLMTSTKRTHFFKLDKVELLNEDLVSLYGQLTEMSSNREKMARYAALSNSVFQKLVPVEVFNEIKGKKLTIVSDYILQQIPFESFVVDKENGRYLIEDIEIRYAYSMSYLDAKKGIEQNPEKQLLGLAPVQFASLGLPDLAFSGEEVYEVNKIFEGQIALNDKATKNSLLADLNNFKIVHLSTHADVGEGGNPWIAFSDEKLFLNEIYANKNQADMVVLSGCNTSLGELKKGEGAMSLARGFFHSGAKSVVSSLWTINDKTSKDLMVSFYRGLDEGMTKAAALRKAKIDYIEKYRGTTVSPSFWAALIVIGDNSPISTSGWGNANWTWVSFGLFVIALCGVLLIRKKKRRTVIRKGSV